MSLARSGVTLLLGLAALAASGVASGDPPPSGQPRPREVPADKDKEERARQAMALHDEAWALYEEGRYRAAVEKLEGALRIDPEGRELEFNLALLHEKLGNLKDAAVHYRRYVEMEPDPKAKAKAQATLRRIEGAEKEAARAVPPPAPPPPAPLPSPPPPRPVRPWVVVTGSVAGAALVVGSGFGLRALGTNPGPNARTGGAVTITDLQAQARTAHTEAMVADVSFVIAAAAATTAMFLYFATPRRPPLSAVALAAPARLQVVF